MTPETITDIQNQLTRIELVIKSRYSPWYTKAEACEYLRCGKSHLHQIMNAGKLKYTRVSDGKTKGKVLFQKRWLNAAAMGYGRKLSPVQRREVDDLE